MGAAHFRHIKRYFVNVEGGLAALWGDAENGDFCGVSPLAGDGEEIMGVFVAGAPASRDVWIVEEGLHEDLEEAPMGTDRDGA